MSEKNHHAKPKGSAKSGQKPKQTRTKLLRALSRAKAPRNVEQFVALPGHAQENWTKVARVVQAMRRDGISLTQAAKDYDISRKRVAELAGSALKKQTNGRYTAKQFDRLLRVLVIPSGEGRTEIAVRDSRTASKIGEYNAAVQRFVRTGDQSKLRAFKKLKLTDASGNPIKLLTGLRNSCG